LLRARAADRYGAWRDRVPQVREHPDGAALLLKEATRRLAEDGRADLAGRRRLTRAPLRSMIVTDADEPEPDEADRTGSAACCKRYGFTYYGDQTDDDGLDDDDAYADELAAQTADPGARTRGPGVGGPYTSGVDGG